MTLSMLMTVSSPPPTAVPRSHAAEVSFFPFAGHAQVHDDAVDAVRLAARRRRVGEAGDVVVVQVDVRAAVVVVDVRAAAQPVVAFAAFHFVGPVTADQHVAFGPP